MTTAALGRPAGAPSLTRIVAAASLGNALEWFDLTVYGYFAVTISKLFFPTGDPTVSLLITLGTFGVSYLIRPLGAVVLGAYADRAGRKASLMLSIVLMTAGTAIMAFVPTYATIGILAPVLVFASRLMQGFSAGGEFGSSTAFMTEHGSSRKGFLGSWQFSSQGISVTLAALSGFILTGLLSQEQMSAWGWRVPFVFGLLIGPVGFYIRRYVDETPEFAASERTRTPVRDILADQKLRTLLAIGAVGMSTSANYLILYMPTFAIRDLGLPHWTGFLASTVGGIMLTVVAPFIGHWSDTVGRTRIMIGVTVLFLLTALPAFAIVTAYPWTAVLVLLVTWVAVLKASYSGALPALMSEVFPTRTRGTGMSFAYNVGVTLFGGFAPTIIAALIQATGTNLAPSFYLMFVACLSLAALVLARRLLRLH